MFFQRKSKKERDKERRKFEKEMDKGRRRMEKDVGELKTAPMTISTTIRELTHQQRIFTRSPRTKDVGEAIRRSIQAAYGSKSSFEIHNKECKRLTNAFFRRNLYTYKYNGSLLYSGKPLVMVDIIVEIDEPNRKQNHTAEGEFKIQNTGAQMDD